MEIRAIDRGTLFPWIAAACVGLASFAIKEVTPKSYGQVLKPWQIAQANDPAPKKHVPAGTTDVSNLLNQSAPDFSLSDVSGAPQALSTWRGRVVVLNFWGFWCDTWKAELPYLKDLSDRQSDLGFKLVAVSVDGTRLSEFDAHKGTITFPVLLDVGGNTRKSYEVSHVPTVVVIDRNGIVRYVKSGYPGNDAVLSIVRKLSS
jgi:peroxiredoxin